MTFLIEQPESVDITPEIAANVLHFFRGDEGFAASYAFHLLYLHAAELDDDNLVKLQMAFPAQITAFRVGRDIAGGLDILRSIENGTFVKAEAMPKAIPDD